jgi:hypothetical protein
MKMGSQYGEDEDQGGNKKMDKTETRQLWGRGHVERLVSIYMIDGPSSYYTACSRNMGHYGLSSDVLKKC